MRVPLGFEFRQVSVVNPQLDRYGMRPAAARDYWTRLDASLRAQPGVLNTAIASLPPFGNRLTVNRQGMVLNRVTPEYFATMSIPILQGRLFGSDERGMTLVGDALARRTWRGEDPVGKRFEGATVIGVAGNARTIRIADDASSECYLPMDDDHLARAAMIVRAAPPLLRCSRPRGVER